MPRRFVFGVRSREARADGCVDNSLNLNVYRRRVRRNVGEGLQL
jgi:hypothetical protein